MESRIAEQQIELRAPAVSEAHAEQSRGLLENIRNTRLGNMLALGGAAVALVAGGEAVNADKAEATAITVPAEITTDTVTIKSGRSTVRANSFSAVNLMTNHRTVSKALIKDAKDEGDCRWINGKKEDIWVEGLGPGGVGFGKDTRKSLFCEVDKDVNGDGKVNENDLARAICGNEAMLVPPKKEIENALWTDSRSKGKIKVIARSSAVAKASCEVNGVSAYAEGRGFAAAKGFAKIKSAIKTKGTSVSKLMQKVSLRAKGWAKSKASAQASVVCAEMGGEIVPTVPAQHKDGTQTPQPPAEAPGPNPAPSPNEPYPGGYQCYDEVTGAPVPPRSDDTCPVGSVGA